MIPKTLFEAGAEKFVLFETNDGSYFLRGLALPYHNDISERFSAQAERSGLKVVRRAGAKFYIGKDTVQLYDFSAAWGYFPDDWKPKLFELFQEAFPRKKIVDKLAT